MILKLKYKNNAQMLVLDEILKNIQYFSEERTTQPQVYNAMQNDVR